MDCQAQGFSFPVDIARSTGMSRARPRRIIGWQFIPAIVLVCLTYSSQRLLAGESMLRGHFRCGVTNYMWPSSWEDSPVVTGSGVVEFDADGEGNITSGSLSQHLADDTRAFGDKSCNFSLVSGKYRMTSGDTGTLTITWRLRPGSDTHCGGYPNLGRTESGKDYRAVSSMSNFFTAENGGLRWISAVGPGVAMGACVPASL